jgi:pyrroloquinoline-quinone synthase
MTLAGMRQSATLNQQGAHPGAQLHPYQPSTALITDAGTELSRAPIHSSGILSMEIPMHSLTGDEALCQGRPDSMAAYTFDRARAGSIPLGVSAMQLLDMLAQRNVERVRQHPFVRRCASGKVTLSALRTFLAQQGKYAAFNMRYLCALIANLDDAGDAMRLAQDLAVELGFSGDEEPHTVTYTDMLSDFGVDLKRSPTLPGAQGLIDTMSYYCRQADPVHGLAALYLGAEAILPDLYSDVMHGFTAHGVPPECLEFFRRHIERENGQGKTMRNILARMLDQDPQHTDTVLEASTRLIEARLSFLTNIEWEAA